MSKRSASRGDAMRVAAAFCFNGKRAKRKRKRDAAAFRRRRRARSHAARERASEWRVARMTRVRARVLVNMSRRWRR